MTDHKLPPAHFVLLKRLLLLIYGPLAFFYVALAPVFCGRKNGFRRWYWRISRRLIRILLNALSIRIDIDDLSLAALSEHKGSLIVANHKSHLDVLALISIIPEDRWVTFGAKIELTKIPFFKRGFASAGILIVDRSDGKTALHSLIDCYKRADPRVSLVLFAEGTRVNGYKLGKFKPGAIKIAQNLNKDIQPVCIFGTNDIMPRHRTIPGVGVITIRVLDNFRVDIDGKVAEEMAALQSHMSGWYAELQTEIRENGI